MTDRRDDAQDGFDAEDYDEAQAEIDADLDRDDTVDDAPVAEGDEPDGDDAPVAEGDEPDEERVPSFLAEPPAEPEPGAASSADAPADDAPAGDDEPTAVLPVVTEPIAEPQPDPTPAAAATAPTPVEEEPVPEEPRRKVRWGRWVFAAIVVLLVVGYGAAAVYASGRIPAGTTVEGVDIGGMTRDEAVTALKPTVREINTTPITLTAGDKTATIQPTDSGLAAGAGATVDQLLRFSLAPYDVLRAFTGRGETVELVTVVDSDALVKAIDGTRDQLEVDGQDASVQISDTGASATPAVDGQALDAQATADGLGPAWPVDTYAAVMDAKPATVTTEDADAFVKELNSQTLAADVHLTGPNGDVTVTSEQLVRYSSVEDKDGTLTLVVDGKGLAAELQSNDPGLVSDPSPASFRFDASHQIHVTKSTTGKEIAGGKLGAAVVTAAESPGRTGELPYKETDADVTSDDLGVDDFKTIVSSFDTPLTPEPIRTQNLVVGARHVTGSVVKPGETFSLIDALSPITEAGGYQPAHIIENGHLINGIGGGLSQMATTTYNAAYFAGLEDVEHRPHTKWFTRYPAGREATIYVGSLDMRFKNNTPYALVLNSYVENNSLHVDVWSTKYFTVKTYASDKTNVVQAKMTESDREGCIATPVGNPGFTITNTREVYLKGKQVDKSSYTWTYVPDDGVTCTAP
ncbi:VanW family protein [Demequina soli]|uniref:VanW family protein n=1 Tax=Demequina soli TaxID=1638987 RepID=UPI0007838642|nr:VanW family protein [Demequina soli]